MRRLESRNSRSGLRARHIAEDKFARCFGSERYGRASFFGFKAVSLFGIIQSGRPEPNRRFQLLYVQRTVRSDYLAGCGARCKPVNKASTVESISA
jgi:hypothetical protein